MNRTQKTFATTVALASLSVGLGIQGSAAGIMNFDDIYLSAPYETAYQAPYGVTISGPSMYVQGGLGNGDPGNWDIEGTNGSVFLGCNGGNNCAPTFSLSGPTSAFSIDIILGAAISQEATFTVTAFLGAVEVGSEVFSLTSTNTIPETSGPHKSVFFGTQLDSVVVSSVFVPNGFFFGMDNVRTGSDAIRPGQSVPAPAALGLFGFGLAGLGYARRRKNTV